MCALAAGDALRMLKSVRLLALLAAVAALWAVPSIASATDYCVANQACVDAGGVPENDIQSALNAAKNVTFGNDRVLIGEGDFTTPSTYYYDTASSLNTVQIIGAGRDKTRLHSTTTTPFSTTLSLTGQSKSSVSDLTVVSPDPIPNGYFHALELTGAASRIGVEGQKNSGLILVRLDGAQALLDHALIHHLSGGGDTAIETDGGTVAAIVDSTIYDPDGTGVYADDGSSTRITRLSFSGRRGVFAAGGNTRVESSRFSVTTSGLEANYNAALALDHVTALGNAASFWSGVSAAPQFTGNATKVTVRNSVITGFTHSLTRSAAAGTTADITAAHSDFDPSTIQSIGPGTLDTSTENISAPPGFVDVASGDFHLAPGSSLVDAGDPAGLAPGEVDTDLDGNPRVVGRTDIGAYEKQPDPPAPQTPSAAPSGSGSGPGIQQPAPVAPHIVVSGARKQRIGKRRAIVLKVTSDQAITLRARTILRLRGVRGAIALRSLTTTHGAGTFKVRLRLSRAQAAKVLRAHSATAQVRVTASSAGSLSATAKRAVKLVR